MTMEEIESEFDQQWVLVNDPVTDDKLRVVEGRVRYHSEHRDKVYWASEHLGSKRAAILFVGERFPENHAFLL